MKMSCSYTPKMHGPLEGGAYEEGDIDSCLLLGKGESVSFKARTPFGQPCLGCIASHPCV